MSQASRAHPSLADLRRGYPAAKIEQNLGKLWRWSVIGPLSFFVAWTASRLGLSANQVTGVSLLTTLAASGVSARGGDTALLAGVLLFNLAYLFDCSDGHLARYAGAKGGTGKFLDDSAAGVFTTALWLGLGVGLYRDPSATTTLELTALATPMVHLFCGALAAVSLLLRSNLGLRFRISFEPSTGSTAPPSPSGSPAGRGPRRFALAAYQNVIGFGGLLGPLLIAAAGLGILGPVVVCYGLLYSALFVIAGAIMVRAALRQPG